VWTADSIRNLLGFGSPRDELFGRRMLVLSRVGYMLLLIAAIAAVVMTVRAADADKWVNHSLDVRSQARELYRNIQDAIIRERGFLLTGDQQYLGNFEQLTVSFAPLLDSLQSVITDNPDQSRRLAAVEPKIFDLRDTLKKTVDLFEGGQKEQALEVVKSNRILTLDSDVKSSLDEFIQAEQVCWRIGKTGPRCCRTCFCFSSR